MGQVRMGEQTIRLKAIAFILLMGGLAPGMGAAQRAIDGAKSRLVVTVYKAGLFSLFAHNHEIAAPIAFGSAETGQSPAVDLQIDAGSLRVLDPEANAGTRAEIQKTMLGPEVLDAARFPAIRFVSLQVSEIGQKTWRIDGDLTLHGQTHPLTIQVTEAQGEYRGFVTIRQSDFGIRPIRLAGGTVRVKDAVRVRFRVILETSPSAGAQAVQGIR